MHGWRGILAGVVGLSLFELVVSTSSGSTAVGAMFKYPAQWISDLADPSKPGLPAAKSTSSTSTSSTTTTGSTVPASGLSGTPTTTGTGSTLLDTSHIPT